VLGPGLYLSSGHDERQGHGEGDSDQGREWTLGVGVLFGLTEASADAALRVTFAVEY
jgi:hypothetical protein